MAYDPYEQFREDPGEMELSDEFNAQMQLRQQAEQVEETTQQPEQPAQPSTPTGGQPEQPQPQATSTEEATQEDIEFDPSKDYSI